MNGKVLLVGGCADGRWVPDNKMRPILMLKQPEMRDDSWEQPFPGALLTSEVETYRPVRFTGSTPGVEIVVYAWEGVDATAILLKLVDGYRPETEEQKNAKGTK